jgi:hypothetical protein
MADGGGIGGVQLAGCFTDALGVWKAWMYSPTDFLTRTATVSSWGDESILAISDAGYVTDALGVWKARMYSPTDFLTRTATVSSWGDESILAISDATYTMRDNADTTHLGGLHGVLRQPTLIAESRPSSSGS